MGKCMWWKVKVTCDGILGVGGCHVKILTVHRDRGQGTGCLLRTEREVFMERVEGKGAQFRDNGFRVQ